MAYTDGSYIAPKRRESTDDPSENQTPEQTPKASEGSPAPAPRGKVPRIGAAVYIPSQQAGSTTEETEVACLPSDEAYTFDDTINRAELAAAWKAISMKCSHIATDSLAALFQIHKIITKPQDIRLGFHRHAALLQQIAQSIASNGRKIHLYKVKSHIGIPGNERADEIATSVAKGTRKPDEVIATSSNTRPSMAWPHHPEVLEPGKEVPSPPVPVKDIASLQKMAHRCHKLGSSNTATICFAATQAIAHDVEKVSHAFMTSTVVPFREMVNTLKVQTGTFYSQKRAWWYGRASSDRCVLCGQPDGTLHAVSGCPDLSLAVTKRHNDAVLLLTKAILTGEHGAQVVATDVSTAAQRADGVQVMTQFIPEKILPRGMPAEEQAALVKAHKPDIVLYQEGQGAHKKNKYTFVEVKYCRDTQPQDQIMHAQEQHHELLQAIQKHSSADDTDIQLVVVPLGVAGTIYTSAKQLIKDQLGVTGPALETLLRNLHLHAVHSLTRIIRYRRIKMGTRIGKQWGRDPSVRKDACTAGMHASKGTSRRVGTTAAAATMRHRAEPAENATAPTYQTSDTAARETKRKSEGSIPSQAYCWGWSWGWGFGV